MDFHLLTGGPVDGPAAVLLHGFPQNATMWRAVAPALHAAGLRTIAPDQRGYSPGARPTDPDDYKIELLAGDVLSIMDGCGVDRAHVVGHDWGAVVGWWLAARYPARVCTFTAISVPHPRALARALFADSDQRERMSHVTLFRNAGKAEEVLLADRGARLRAMLADSGLPPADLDRYVTPLLEPGALSGALNWYRAIDLTDPLGVGDVVVPTTYLWGEHDIAVGPRAARECARYVTAEYRFVPLAGEGHWVPDRAPDVVAREVLRRIAGGDPR